MLHPLSGRLGRTGPQRPPIDLRVLIGSGDKIGLAVLPFLIAGVIANAIDRAAFSVGGPSEVLRVASIVVLIVGVAIWAWSVLLILTRVPRGELITDGPFALVKHPLYTSVALFVLPWLGFLLDTWLGVAVGLVLYAASRRYAPAEEADLARTFGSAWDRYRRNVKIPWL
jgi:protein-S-isoprenylcysteine O-methyltransferase Ste14